MNKNQLKDTLFLLLFFLFPGFIQVLRIFDSYAGGLFIVLAIIFTYYFYIFKFKISRAVLNVMLFGVFLFVLQFINHFFFIKNDYLKTLSISLSLPIIYYVCEKFYYGILDKKNFSKMIEITCYIVIFLIFVGILYYERSVTTGFDNYSSYYRLFFFNEPSHVPVICGPLFVICIFIKKIKSSIALRLIVISSLIFFLGTATGLIFLILLFFTTYKLPRFIFISIYLSIILFSLNMLSIPFIDNFLNMFIDRIDSFIEAFGRESYRGLNLSTIIFIQGYEFIWDTIVRLDFLGIGSGNGFYHIIDYPAFNANVWLHGQYRLNTTDPGFMLSKIILEYGLILGFIYLIVIYKLSKYFFIIRNKILNLDYNIIDVVYIGTFLTTIINTFFRGGGYLHYGMFYLFLSIIIYIHRHERKKK